MNTDELSRRVTDLERRVEQLETWGQTRYAAPVMQSHGCVCPVGAEATCQRPMCQRKGWKIT